MSASRSRHLVRVLRLQRHLQHGRWTLVALAHTLGVSPRTVRRDLAVLAAAGLPVQTIGADGPRVWWIGPPALAESA